MLHCLHNALLSISGELGTGDPVCSAVQPEADLLVFTGFPVTYRARWHLRPDGALTLSTAEQVVLVLLHLSLDTRFPYIKAKVAQSDSGGQAELRFGLEDEGSGPGCWMPAHCRRLGAAFTDPDIARDGSKPTFSKCLSVPHPK